MGFLLQVLFRHPPFLPHSGEKQHLGNAEAALLDRQFRLLRENMVQPLRQTLQALDLVEAIEDSGRNKHTATMSAEEAQRDAFEVASIAGVVLKPRERACVMVAIHLPESHRAARMNSETERLEFWTEYGRGTLPSDALVCLVHCAPTGGRPAEQSLQPLVFGTTARREPKELAKKHPLVGIAFDRGQAAEHLLTRFGEV